MPDESPVGGASGSNSEASEPSSEPARGDVGTEPDDAYREYPPVEPYDDRRRPPKQTFIGARFSEEEGVNTGSICWGSM